MRLGLLASSFLMLAMASAKAATGASLIQPSDGPGLWSTAASLSTGREEHTATLLPNGKVLVAGGTDGKDNTVYSAELYDPATNRWTPAGSMSTAHVDHTATLLPSGKVLVAGGFIVQLPSNPLAGAELYNPATNSWSVAAPMIEPRTRHTATPLPDGRVLVTGGQKLDGALFGVATDAEIYDPEANSWSATAPMAINRIGQTATRLSDGRVLVAGGGDETGGILNSTEIYDATQDRWISAAPMAVARSGHVAALMANGDVLVAGGIGEEPNALNLSLTSAELYDPRTNIWVTVANMVDFHPEDTVTPLRNGMVLVVGATGRSRPELYDLKHNRWSLTGPTMDRYRHSATRLRDGKVLIVGGYGLESLGSVLIYDPEAAAAVLVRPPDPRVIAALVLTALLLLAGAAWSIPGVRLRLSGWGHPGEPDEWIA